MCDRRALISLLLGELTLQPQACGPQAVRERGSWRTKVGVCSIALLPSIPPPSSPFLLLTPPHPRSDLTPLFLSMHPLCWSSHLLPWPPPCPCWSQPVSPELQARLSSAVPGPLPVASNLAFPNMAVFCLLASTSAFQTCSPAQLPRFYFLIGRIRLWCYLGRFLCHRVIES